MKRLIEEWKRLHLTLDAVIVALSIALVICLTLTFLYPKNSMFLYAAFVAGGTINITNGLKTVQDKRKRTIGMSYIFFGILIILLGFLSGRLMNG